ncbi:MAG: hypothetical protein FWC64_06895 [Treponema sp.]|nr:hypothetical protein [Treponema sp.]
MEQEKLKRLIDFLDGEGYVLVGMSKEVVRLDGGTITSKYAYTALRIVSKAVYEEMRAYGE